MSKRSEFIDIQVARGIRPEAAERGALQLLLAHRGVEQIRDDRARAAAQAMLDEALEVSQGLR